MSCLDATIDGVFETPQLAHDKPTLHFVTCGSVDDGKSTLVGRLLYDSKCCSTTS
jgi:bifunctional enzyme CysN/CysC